MGGANRSDESAGRFEASVAVLLWLSFGAKGVFFALRIGPGIFPDEATWFSLSELHSRSLLLPQDSPESHPLGLVTHVPWLYFWLMGRLLALDGFPLSDLLFLRLANVVLSLATVAFAWRVARLLSGDVAVRLLFLFMLTHTLMFGFLSAAVSYDNLVNLLAVVSLHRLLLFCRDRRASDLLLLGIVLMLGCLTKTSFLPYAVLVVGVALWSARRELAGIGAGLGRSLAAREPRSLLRAGAALLLLALNLQLWGGNLLAFGRLVPSPTQVLSEEEALRNRIYARGAALRKYRSGEIDLAEARELARQIPHAGDRRDALLLLRIAAAERSAGSAYRMDPASYTVVWLQRILAKTYGIMAHRNLFKKGWELAPYLAVLLFAAGAFVVRWRSEDLAGRKWVLVFLTAGYSLILIYAVNYRSYRGTGLVDFAQQGRYVFPVLVPFTLLVAHHLIGWMSRRWQWAVGLLVAAVFLQGDLAWFLRKADAAWFSTPVRAAARLDRGRRVLAATEARPATDGAGQRDDLR